GNDDIEVFKDWVVGMIAYPEEAIILKIEGRMEMQFVVNEKGEVKDVQVYKSAHPLLDREALRVVRHSPKWTPAVMCGKIMSVTQRFPIVFKLPPPDEYRLSPN
ncbi:MAG: energy transducer TonB, partial [Prevotellaceae bacterium]|nr:energy transducer TonB [Prevotellaceae bacterium]